MTDSTSPPRHFDGVPPAEARAIFEWYVADQEVQAAALWRTAQRKTRPT